VLLVRLLVCSLHRSIHQRLHADGDGTTRQPTHQLTNLRAH